jgi:hypothetical protein
MTKIKCYGVHETTINYEPVQYFYRCEGFTPNGTPKWRVFIIDPDSRIYEFTLRCYEIEIEDRIQALFEGDNV